MDRSGVGQAGIGDFDASRRSWLIAGVPIAMPKDPLLPPEVVARKQAAAMLGVSCKRVTNMRWQGQLEPVTAPHREIGLFDRAQVEAVAAQRESRQFENEMRRAQPPAPSRPLPRRPRGHLGGPAGRGPSGPARTLARFVDTDGAAEILGVTP